MARPSWPGKPSSASCWGGDLSAQGERPAHCSQHISLSTVRPLQKCRAAKHVSPTEGFQARTGQLQGGRCTADTSQQPREGERGTGGRGCPGRTERRLSAPGCLWALALRTSPLADRAEVPSTVTSFPISILPTLSGLTYTVLNLRCSPLAGTTIKPHLPLQCTHHFPPWPKPPPPGPLQSLPPGLLLLPHEYPPQVARGSI